MPRQRPGEQQQRAKGDIAVQVTRGDAGLLPTLQGQSAQTPNRSR
jgi:hypothetical protein